MSIQIISTVLVAASRFSPAITSVAATSAVGEVPPVNATVVTARM